MTCPNLPSFVSQLAALAGASLLVLSACSGSTDSQFPASGGSGPGSNGNTSGTAGSGGSGASGASGTGTAGNGGRGGNDPCDCGNDAYIPVCGEDGMTYNANCGVECVPVRIDCEGECPCDGPPSCSDLELEYAEVLKTAKNCSPMLAVEQCLVPAQTELACPCPTWVEQANSAAIMRLAELQSLWNQLNCQNGVGCPDVECPMPAGASCLPNSNGTSGSCTDVLASP